MNKKNIHEPLSPQESDEMWQKIISRIRNQEIEKKKKKLRRYYTLVSAAAIIIIGVLILGYKTMLTPEVYYAETQNVSITLKDGSTVTLLKGAQLQVDRSFPTENREVYLQGNAIFHVAKSKTPFIVHGNNYQTKVLGTVFKVVQNGQSFTVDLYEGKVQVSKNDKPDYQYTLKPKETFSNLGSLKMASVKPTDQKAEIERQRVTTLAFSDATLNEVISAIQDIYGIQIRYPQEIGSSKITLSTQTTEEDALIEMIAFQFNLKAKKINDTTFELEE